MKEQSGIFLVNKPKDMTSNDLLQKIKRQFKEAKKVGHAGTLDPNATGLMIVLINQATKISNFLLSEDKEYVVDILLFTDTDSKDITGNVIRTQEPFKLDKKQIKAVIDKYNGYMYEQYPPIYSAIKVKGKKLYEYARENKEDQVEIKPRTVTINECELLDYNSKEHILKLKIHCSKGTYIRSLAYDIAAELGALGTVKELDRTQSGSFKVEDACKLEELKFENLIPMYDALLKSKLTLIEQHNELEIKQGKPLQLVNQADEFVFIINSQKDVLAVYRRAAHELYVCQRGLWVQDPDEVLTSAERDRT